MKLPQLFLRLGVVAALLGSLSACTIVPAHPHAYYGPSVQIETYPVYRYGPPHRHYHHDRRHYHYRDDRHDDSAFDRAARSHREIRRSLGLPRLPGMP